jgi:F-type H+-transporting ATPase subunit b
VLINWFTVLAQIVNFLILVVLLKFLLYDRIIKAMDEREAKIRSRLNEAKAKAKEAEQEADTFRLKNQKFEDTREAMLAQAKQDAEAHRKELTEQARHAATSLKSAWQDAIQREKATFIQNLKTSTGTQVYAIARKALSDIADADLEDRTIQIFLSAIRGIDKKKRDALVGSIKTAGDEVLIRSAFELSPAQRQKVTRALHKHFSDAITVHYETRSELIMGIELKVQGHKIAWTLQDYLDGLEGNTLRILDKEVQRKSDMNEKSVASKKDKEKKVENAIFTEKKGSGKDKKK